MAAQKFFLDINKLRGLLVERLLFCDPDTKRYLFLVLNVDRPSLLNYKVTWKDTSYHFETLEAAVAKFNELG